MATVSIFTRINNKAPYGAHNVEDVISQIRDNRHKEKILTAREYLQKGDLEAYKTIKNSLPYVTWAGKFSKRELKSLVSLTGYIYFDIDSEIEPINLISQFDFVKYAWKSLSNIGVGLLVKIDDLTTENFKDNYHFIKDLFFEKGVKVDVLDDYSRANILSFSEVFENKEATVFSAIEYYEPYRSTLATKVEVSFIDNSDFAEAEEDMLRVALGHVIKWLHQNNSKYGDGVRYNFLLKFFGTVIKATNIDMFTAIEFLMKENYWFLDPMFPDYEWDSRAKTEISRWYNEFKK